MHGVHVMAVRSRKRVSVLVGDIELQSWYEGEEGSGVELLKISCCILVSHRPAASELSRYKSARSASIVGPGQGVDKV